MTVPTVESLTTLGGLVIVITLFVQGVKTVAPSLDFARFGALISVVCGLILALIANLALGVGGTVPLLNAGLLGIFAGLAASGLYDAATKPITGRTPVAIEGSAVEVKSAKA